MDLEKFASLTERQKQAMLLGIEVRNTMEDFHVKYLSDEQMKELNPIIRQGIINVIELWDEYKRFMKTRKVNGKMSEYVSWAIMTIPDYWEPPEDDYYKRSIKKNRKRTTT